MLAPTPRILALSPPAAVRAPRISVAKRIVGAELSLSFPLPRRTAPFLLPRIALYPQSAWWRGCGGLLDGGCGAAAAAARRGGVCDWATKSKQSMSITSMQTYLYYTKTSQAFNAGSILHKHEASNSSQCSATKA